MKKQWFLCILFSGCILLSHGQGDPKFTVEVSTDSVLLGNYIHVSFRLENAKGTEFVAPVFEGFSVISGPNVSSSFSMMNGEVTQSVAYNYYLEPKDIGNFYISPASIDVGESILETMPIEILVVPNPDGIIQKPEPSRNNLNFNMEGFEFPGFRDFPGLEDFYFHPPGSWKKQQPDDERRENTPKKKKRKTVKI